MVLQHVGLAGGLHLGGELLPCRLAADGLAGGLLRIGHCRRKERVCVEGRENDREIRGGRKRVVGGNEICIVP